MEKSDENIARLLLEMNLKTGQIICNLPQHPVLALGLLEYAREVLVMRFIRPTMTQEEVAAGGLSESLKM